MKYLSGILSSTACFELYVNQPLTARMLGVLVHKLRLEHEMLKEIELDQYVVPFAKYLSDEECDAR